VETFEHSRDFVEHSSYAQDRTTVLSALDPATIDAPILDVVQGFAQLPHCFTLQSCFGHFTWDGQPDTRGLQTLPARDVGLVTYSVAYLALCIEHSPAGVRLRESLERVPAVDRQCVQFGSPGWFWDQYPNSYALQVEPERFRFQDRAAMRHDEALHVQAVRDRFFAHLRELVAAQSEVGAG
jgi:hypothetical protein